MKKIKSIFKYASKYRKRYLFGLFFLVLIDLLQLVPPKLIGYITDSMAKGTATSSLLIKYILFIILIAVVMSIGRFIWRIFIVGTSRYVEYDIRNKFFKHLQGLSPEYFNKNKTGDLMALATNDLNAVRMALGPGIIMLTDAIVMSLSTIIIMLSINVKLTLLSLIPLPLVSLIASKFGKKIHKKFMKVQDSFSKLTDVVQENFSGIRIVKSFVQEEKECEKFTRQNEKYFKVNMEFLKVWGVFQPLVQFIASLSFVILIGLGGVYVIYNDISLGNFISFNMYLMNLVWPMMAIGWVVNVIQRGFASLERIENVLNEKPSILDKNVADISSINGDIVMNNLTFTYPTAKEPSIKDINLTIRKGSKLGILGRTGSGKSTLVNVLLRLYNVDDGKITINGTDINRIPLKVIRENIGVVTQDSFLFSQSVSDNINLPNEDFNFERIKEAATNADVYENIMDFPNKFETMVGERGVTLSGGQKQRISIARALIKNPEILILDDCLSAVDAKTEVKILENLKRIMENRTSIIISHRISALKDCNQIIVLDDGKITEMGSHNQLVSTKGLYNDIYEKQLLEEKIEGEDGDCNE